MNLETQVFDTIQKFHMISPGDQVIVGISGGADSVCLLLVLKNLAKRLQIGIRAVHVHHGLRKTADRDEEFTSDLCGSLGIPLHVVHADVRGEAVRRHRSIEETGREIRYEAFQSCAEKASAESNRNSRIAVAHHREDSAETVLMNLCRGTSLAGLGGILPVSGKSAQHVRSIQSVEPTKSVQSAPSVPVIRPLIDCGRNDIEAYLREHGQTWCTDETNAELVYTRNYVRNVILPELTAHVNEQCVSHISRTAEDLREAEEFLSGLTRQSMESCRLGNGTPEDASKTAGQVRTSVSCSAADEPLEMTPGRNGGKAAYSAERLLALEPYLRRRVLYAILKEAAGGGRDLTFAQVEELQKLLQTTGSHQVSLPGGLIACKEYGVLRLQREPDTEGNISLTPDGSPLQIPGSKRSADEPWRGESDQSLPWPTCREAYTMRVFPYAGDPAAIPHGTYTKWFDYDKIATLLTFRTRQTDDRMALEDHRYKKLTRMMIDAKIPASVRDRMLLPADGDRILWLPGGRISAEHQVDASTRTILELSISRPQGLR